MMITIRTISVNGINHISIQISLLTIFLTHPQEMSATLLSPSNFQSAEIMWASFITFRYCHCSRPSTPGSSSSVKTTIEGYTFTSANNLSNDQILVYICRLNLYWTFSPHLEDFDMEDQPLICDQNISSHLSIDQHPLSASCSLTYLNTISTKIQKIQRTFFFITSQTLIQIALTSTYLWK